MRVPCIVEVVGTLADLARDDGEMVMEGDHICSVECMKTFFPIYAAASGRLHFLRDLGEVVEEGEIVAEIETS